MISAQTMNRVSRIDTRSQVAVAYGVALLFLASFSLVLFVPKPNIVNVIVNRIPRTIEAISIESIELILHGGSQAASQAVDGQYVIEREKPPIKIEVNVPKEIDVPRVTPTNLPPSNVIGDPNGTANNRTTTAQIGRQTITTIPVVKPIETPTDEPLEFAEVDPTFDYNQLRSSIRYPENAKKLGVEGKVVVRVLVNTDGSILQTEIFASDNSLLETEALRAIQATQFQPARQNGTTVRCWMYVPIQFSLR